MPIFQAWGVSCNACGEPLDPWLQYETYAAARRSATDNGWYIGPDGTCLCPDCDGENE